MAKQGVQVDQFRAVDHPIATGVYPDMREHGWDVDEWPELFGRGSSPPTSWSSAGPIWLGDNSSETKKIIERLYAHSGELNDKRPVAVLRQGRRLPDHRQRGRHQALHVQRALQPAAHRLQHPAAGRRRLDRRSRTRAQLRRRARRRHPRRAGQRVHQPQHHLHDLEPAAPGPDAQAPRAASPPTATSAANGTQAPASTSRTPNTAPSAPAARGRSVRRVGSRRTSAAP